MAIRVEVSITIRKQTIRPLIEKHRHPSCSGHPRRLNAVGALLVASLAPGLPLQAVEPAAPMKPGQVCTGISGFPDAEDPDRFLARLGTSRTEVIRDLGRLRRNLEQVEAEGQDCCDNL